MVSKATLVGRVGKKDIKDLKNGGQMTTLSIATTKKYKDSFGEQQVITTWHNVNFFSKFAEVAQKYAHVGDLVYIEGDINNKKIEHGEYAGQWSYSVTATEIKFLSSRSKKTEESNKNKTKKNNNDPNYTQIDLDDEVPF